jgi:type IV fimbrial biogenesis protein FimT
MFRNPHNGFSLIELAITVALFGILVSLAMPTFSTFIANSRVRTAAEGMVNGLQIARAEAVRRNTFVSLQIGANGISWDVVASDGTTIQTRGVEPGNAVTPATIVPLGTTAVTYAGMGRMIAVKNAGVTADPPAVFAIRYIATGRNPPTDGTRAMCVVIVNNAPRLCDPQRGDMDDAQGCFFNRAPITQCN